MKKLLAILFLLSVIHAQAQTVTGMDEFGNTTQIDADRGNFNPHNTDTTHKSKVIPKGIYVWTVDRKLGDIAKADVDTLPYLYPQSTLGMGRQGQFNTLGSNYLARLSRIYIDRPEQEQFIFTQAYSQTEKKPDKWHFTNTLSPITNLSYDNCGDKTTGEDHLDAKFAVNSGKRLGMGFDIDYAYARGYFQNQNVSHFNASLYASYLGDKYLLHMLFTVRDQKAAENGGITNDDYVTHPELFSESYSDNEIPTVLSYNWNRNHSQHLFVTHRYNLGFYRKVKMTDDEIKARQFAKQSQKDNPKKTATDKASALTTRPTEQPAGRPEGSTIAGKAPTLPAVDTLTTSILSSDSLRSDSLLAGTQPAESNRIKVDSKAKSDSLLAISAANDSLQDLMKNEFVPVTSFIHTVELDNYNHIYQAYATPTDYYANSYYNRTEGKGYTGDSIYDQTKYFGLKNTLGLALLEGFNKWARAGIKLFATHELRQVRMPYTDDKQTAYMKQWTEHNLSLGARLSKTQGRTLHYSLTGETWVVGEDAGQLKVDFSTDLNFPLWGDTVRLAAKAFFHRINPTFFERNYHSKHLWWDITPEMTTRTRVEGIFRYDKTQTQLRIAIEELQNYTYFGMSYNYTTSSRTQTSAGLYQHSGNINILTAQLEQKLQLGPLHWDNVVTCQSSSEQDVLPLPVFNVFSNLYLRFSIASVLRVELGGSATYFTKYYAPDYCPQLNQFAIQQEADSRIKLGNIPFVDVYANLHLKHARFFIMMSNVASSALSRMNFLTPHHPLNRSVLHMGVSWNFFN